MNDATAAHAVELAMMMASAGFAFGLVYFTALKRTVAIFATGRGLLTPLALTVARFAAAIAFLVIAAKLGAVALLAAFVGFLLARSVILRLAQRSG
jgi:F1-F0 ATPase (N-ATPase) AtpR subunit